MTAAKKIAQKRLTLLQLAEGIRNVSEACRHHGVCRSQFYEYKRAFQERGFDGLLDRPPMPMSFPNESPPEFREKVIALSLKHPSWGPMKSRSHDLPICVPTVMEAGIECFIQHKAPLCVDAMNAIACTIGILLMLIEFSTMRIKV